MLFDNRVVEMVDRAAGNSGDITSCRSVIAGFQGKILPGPGLKKECSGNRSTLT